MEEEKADESQLTKQEKRLLKKEKKLEEIKKQDVSQKTQKFIFLGIAVIIVGFLGFRIYKYFTAPIDTSVQSLYSISENDWVKGNPDANVQIIEYGDFECPACAIYSPLVNDVYEKYKDDVKITFRHFPLSQHRKAEIGSRAAEAAGRQGKFWEMHDVLFDKQEEWVSAGNSKDKVFEYAQGLGLDMEKFENDYNSDEVKNKIDSDTTSGFQLRVDSTPTFYVNGKKLGAVRGIEDFDKAIEDAMSK